MKFKLLIGTSVIAIASSFALADDRTDTTNSGTDRGTSGTGGTYSSDTTTSSGMGGRTGNQGTQSSYGNNRGNSRGDTNAPIDTEDTDSGGSGTRQTPNGGGTSQ